MAVGAVGAVGADVGAEVVGCDVGERVIGEIVVGAIVVGGAVDMPMPTGAVGEYVTGANVAAVGAVGTEVGAQVTDRQQHSFNPLG